MGIINYILNILFPPKCASCKKEGEFLCSNCIDSLKIKDLKLNCKYSSNKEFKYLDGVIYGLDYAENPQIKAAIKQFKYYFTQDLKKIFANLITDKLNQLLMIKGKHIVFIPVPLHKKRYYKRGFNQAILISEAVKDIVSCEVDIQCLLKRIRNTPQQAKLNKKERYKNLKGAFEVNDFKLDKNAIYFIVDDVCTTGTTLESCARVLKEAGVKKVYGLVVARAFK